MKWGISKDSPCGPIQAKRFNDAWGKFSSENNTFTELTGVIGVSENSSTLTNLFGGGTHRKDVGEARQRVGDKFNWTISRENATEVVKAILAELLGLKASRPVKDNRRTPEADAQSTAECTQARAERAETEKRERETFTSLYGSGETITIQPGQMAVTARICFDNSDSMTDYFDRHASLSPRFALLVVPKQAEMERLATLAVSKYPALASLAFEWHTEKYSMGHGNYLEDGGFELPPELVGVRNYYRGGAVTHGHWEIEFERAYSHPVELLTIKGYGSDPAPGSKPSQPVTGVTITENAAKAGIEIRFPAKPDAEVLERLKANGWRWSRFSQCWYKRATDDARQFANSFAA